MMTDLFNKRSTKVKKSRFAMLDDVIAGNIIELKGGVIFVKMKNDRSKCWMCDNFLETYNEGHTRWIANLQVSTALLETNQICRGYTILVYNKAHATELFQLTKEDRAAYMEDLNKVAKAIYDAYHPYKMNYELLGNVVPHLHWHIIPRRESDPIELHWPIWGKDYRKVKLSDDEYREIVEEIRAHLT